MALQGWDKNYREQLKIQEQEIESLQQQLMISGKGGSPGQPYDDPEKGKGPFVPAPGKGLMISHGEGRGPQPKYHDEYNRELPIPPWMQMDPSGKLIEIPWMKEQYMKEHPELAAANNIRSFQDSGWKLSPPLSDWKEIPPGIKNDPDFGPLHLRRMQAQLPANNIQRLRPHGWRTDYTGSFRLGDDGKLIPQMYLHKINS